MPPTIEVELASEATESMALHIMDCTCHQLTDLTLSGDTIHFDLNSTYTWSEEDIDMLVEDIENLLIEEETDYHEVRRVD